MFLRDRANTPNLKRTGGRIHIPERITTRRVSAFPHSLSIKETLISGRSWILAQSAPGKSVPATPKADV